MENILENLQNRGFIDAKTSENIKDVLSKPTKVYVGFDPTADSLHLGHLVGVMALAWFQRAGHTPIALIGGATGMIGDPSGKSAERNLLDAKAIEKNIQGIQASLQRLFPSGLVILNNYDWFAKMGCIEFLRDLGKNFRLSTMLAKESVKSRLEGEEGMSFTEFSYQILQAYDFLYLLDAHQVTVQLGGSDQWGNITAGTELIRKVRGTAVYGVTFPLITRSDGKKFGKSEEGAIWLNADKLSPYDFYQYLYRTPDADVVKMLQMVTFVESKEIKEIEKEMAASSYVPNQAQQRLATEVTRFVHGEKGLAEALKMTEHAKPGATTQLNRETLEVLAADTTSIQLPKQEMMQTQLIDLLVRTKAFTSKAEARRMVVNGGVYLNNEKVENVQLVIEPHHVIDGEFLLLGIGKKKKIVIRMQ